MSASISGRFISILTFASLKLIFPTYRQAGLRSTRELNLQNHGHNQRTLLRMLGNKPLQVRSDLLFDNPVIGALFLAGLAQRLDHNLPDFLHEPVLAAGKASRHDFRRNFNFAGQLMDCDDRQHETIFAQMAAIFDNQVFNNVGPGAGVDADAADSYASCFTCAELVEFKNIAALYQHNFPDRVAHGCGQFCMQLELAVLTVNWNEIFGLDQIDDQLELFLAGVPADVDRMRRAILVNDVRLAP